MGAPDGCPSSGRWSRRLSRGVRTVAVGVLVLAVVGGVATRVFAARARAEFPARGEYVVVEGLRQHVLTRGSGPPVVFVHGAFGALQDFSGTILAEAAERYTCVLWDRPGHGYSERPDGEVDPGRQAHLLLDLLRVERIEDPLLVGFSYGGAVCLAAALEAPAQVRGVVLVNGPSHPWPDPLDLEYRVAAVPVLGRLLSETVVTPLGALLARGSVARAFDPLPVPPSFANSPLELALRPASYRANTEDIRLLKPFLREQAHRYGELRVPITALVSTGDRIVSPTIHVPQLVEQAPDCRQVRVENAGHQLLYTHPELVLDTIDEALRRDG